MIGNSLTYVLNKKENKIATKCNIDLMVGIPFGLSSFFLYMIRTRSEGYKKATFDVLLECWI